MVRVCETLVDLIIVWPNRMFLDPISRSGVSVGGPNPFRYGSFAVASDFEGGAAVGVAFAFVGSSVGVPGVGEPAN